MLEKFLLIMAFLTPFVAGQTLWASDSIPKNLNLDLKGCTEIALKNNPDILVARQRRVMAKSRVGEAKSGFWPRLNLASRYTRLSVETEYDLTLLGLKDLGLAYDEYTLTSRLGEADERYDADFTLSQPIYTGGRLSSQLAYARANKTSAESDLHRVEQEIISGVTRAYYEVLKTDRICKVIHETIGQMEGHLRIARAHYEAGLVSRSDVLGAEVHLSDMKQNLIRVQNAHEIAVNFLNSLLGIDLETKLRLKDEVLLLEGDPDLEESLASAYQNRPDWARTQANIEAARVGVRLARVPNYPALNLVGRYGRTGYEFPPDEETWQVGLAANLIIFDGNLTRNQIKGAEANLALMERMRDRLKAMIEIEVRQAILSLQEVKKRLKTIEKNIDQAKESLRVSQVLYKEERVPSMAVIDAQTALMKVKNDYANAVYDYGIAQAQLHKATGVIGKAGL